METDLLPLLLRINLVLAAAIALVLVLRAPVRRVCGARLAYALWLLPIAAAAMCFVPGGVEHIVLQASAISAVPAPSAPEPPYLLWAWASGAFLTLLVLALRQLRFTLALGRLTARDDLGANVRTAQTNTHGPAVLGVLRPVIVTPADFEARFDAEEQSIVLAHERAHVAQGDPLINAVVLVLQCINWFNPLVHLGARALRVDQELACDAAVLARATGMRRRYAEAMLKTHVAAAAPLGCAWPPASINALKERIAMLKHTLPSRTQRLLGGAAIVAVTAAATAVAWAAQPVRIVTTIADDDRRVERIVTEGESDVRTIEVRHETRDTDRNRRVVIRDGEIISDRELTPEEQEEIREAVEEARIAVEAIEIDQEAIREAVQEAMREMEGARLSGGEQVEVRRAMETARAAMANVEVPRHLNAEQRERVREAMAQARAALDESRVEIETSHMSRAEVREAMAAARAAMAEARVELAALPRMRAELAALPLIQEALDEARVEIRREAQEARAEGDMQRAEELERVAQSLERRERIRIRDRDADDED